MKAEFRAQGKEPYEARLDISGFPNNSQQSWTLSFSLAHPFEPMSLEGGEFQNREGDLHTIAVVPESEGCVSLRFSGPGEIKKATDIPYGVFAQQGSHKEAITLDRPASYKRHRDTGNDSKGPCFIPMPTLAVKAQTLSLPKEVQWLSDGPEWQLDWLDRLLVQMEGEPIHKTDCEGWTVRAQQQSDLKEAFELDIHEHGADLMYASDEGFQIGQAYLFQYFLQWRTNGVLSLCRLSGTPRFGYRGLHLDVVRHFFDQADIERWWDVFALFHFNHFHWHLTDDDGWRLESSAYPELTQTGAWRGLDEALPPQMGTGIQRYGGFYSQASAKAVVERLDSLGVTVVPEMDLPGHARALLKSLPQLQETADESQYKSVQFHSDNVINPVIDETREVVQTLMKEWCDVFPGALFHMGCDEVPEGVWVGSPAAQHWAKESDKSVTGVFSYFIETAERDLRELGKTPAGWEEISEGASLQTWVYSWQGVEAGQKAAERGHPVVMTPAQHCYFDLAVTDDFSDPGYWWAGTVDLAKVYHYDPVAGFSGEAAGRVQGVQYCLWTELVETPQQAEFMWFPRLLAGAQVVWGNNTNENFGVFLESARVWSDLLDRLGLHVRSESLTW